MKLKQIYLSFLIAVFMYGCSDSPQSSTPMEASPLKSQRSTQNMSDGTLTIDITAHNSAKNKPIYIKVYTQTDNIFDPTIEPLANLKLELDDNGQAVDTLLANAPAGESFQIFGIIDLSGTEYTHPENRDLYFTELTGPVDGDKKIKIDKNRFISYQTIAGDGFSLKNTGTHHVRIWESEPDKMTSTIGWMGDVDNMLFRFDGATGAIGRVGKTYTDLYVDDIDNSLTNAKAIINYNGADAYYFGIYGWVFSDTGWNNSDIKHEFYVVENMTRDRETDPKIGSITVDGIVYDMHRYEFSNGDGYRFKAIRMSDRRNSGPVNLKPFFEYWAENGMENFLINELTWHIEMLGKNHKNGDIYFWDIEIPDYQNSSRVNNR